VTDIETAKDSKAAAITLLTAEELVTRYEFQNEQLETAKATYLSADVNTTDGYKLAIKGRAIFRDTRLAIEAKRKELKADALAYGKRVDEVAKTLTALVQPHETLLDGKIKAVEAEKERVKREKEEAERVAREAEAKAKADAEAKAERDRIAAERAKAEEEARIERERLAAERAELERQRREQLESIARQKAELDAALKLANEERAQRERDAERLEAMRSAAEQDRLAEVKRQEDEIARQRAALEAEQNRVKLEQEAREQAERERIAAEEAKVAELERQAKLAERLEALKPDCQKLRDFAATLRALPLPEVSAPELWSDLNDITDTVLGCADRLETLASQYTVHYDHG
jgi:hypothetical protein